MAEGCPGTREDLEMRNRTIEGLEEYRLYEGAERTGYASFRDKAQT